MHKLKIIISYLLTCSCLKGQVYHPTPEQVDSLTKASIKDSECAYYKFDKIQTQTFPFSVSDKIELVSFSTRDRNIDSIVSNGRLLLTTIRKKKTLSLPDTDTLFSKIYFYRSNLDIRTKMLTIPAPGCYNPHHAIIFYKKSIPIAYIEICFECTAIEMSKNFEWFGYCSEKFDYFETLFKKYGLTYKLK